MDSFTLVDLFFIITGVAVVFVAALLIIALVYLIVFLRTLKQIANQASRATKLITEDIGEFSKTVKAEGFKLGSFIKFVLGLKSKQTRKKK